MKSVRPIVVLGEALMDCIAQSDGSFKPYLGGSPYNVARALAKQAHPVYFLNPLSTDEFGEQLIKQHQADGVLPGLNRNGLPTSLAMVSFVQGQPSYQFYREGVADRGFTVDQALAFLDHFDTPSILHTGSLALVPPEADKTIAILKAAKQRGWTISIDLNVRPRLALNMDVYRDTLIECIAIADWLKASDEDLEHIWTVRHASQLGFDKALIHADHAAELASKIQALGPSYIAITLGAKGAHIRMNNDGAQGVAPMIKVQDTVGAGDTFWGTALGIWRLNNPTNTQSAEYVLHRAMTAAALNCMQAGCNPPTLTELELAL